MSLSELSFLTPQAGYTEGVEQYCATWKVVCLREEGKDGGQTVWEAHRHINVFCKNSQQNWSHQAFHPSR